MPLSSAFASSVGGGAPATVPAAAGSLRMWLCATLQPLLEGRPRAKQAFFSSGGVAILCRHLAAGPSDVAVHSCGVLTSVLRRGSGGEGGGNDEHHAEAAVEVRAAVVGLYFSRARVCVCWFVAIVSCDFWLWCVAVTLFLCSISFSCKEIYAVRTASMHRKVQLDEIEVVHT